MMEPCGDVVGFSRERARRREVVPLAIGCAARIYPYTIYGWVLRKKSCLTCFVARCDGVLRRRLVMPLMVGGAARTGRETCPYTIKDLFYGESPVKTGFVT